MSDLPERIWVDPHYQNGKRLLHRPPDGSANPQVEYVPAHWEKRAKELEAKLAKAVESLIRIDDLTCHNMPMTAREEQGVNREARAALKELEELPNVGITERRE